MLNEDNVVFLKAWTNSLVKHNKEVKRRTTPNIASRSSIKGQRQYGGKKVFSIYNAVTTGNLHVMKVRARPYTLSNF